MIVSVMNKLSCTASLTRGRPHERRDVLGLLARRAHQSFSSPNRRRRISPLWVWRPETLFLSPTSVKFPGKP